MLTILEAFPSDFAHVSARDLRRVLPGPTLVHLRESGANVYARLLAEHYFSR